MKVIIKEISCVDWEFNKEIELYANKVNTITIGIGIEGEVWTALFYITVCNLDYLKNLIRKTGGVIPFWHLVTEDSSKEHICEYLTKMITAIEGRDWDECLKKLRRIANYEFEDYLAAER